MYRVRTHNRIAQRGLNSFTSEWIQADAEIESPHGLLLRSFKLASEHIDPSVYAIARAGVGVNNIPVAECTQRGIVVFNTPGANANSVKELVLCALLMASRNVLPGIRYVQDLSKSVESSELDREVEANKSRFAGRELMGRTIGVVGLGAIGSSVARACLDLGMEVLGHDKMLSVDAAWRLPSQVKRVDDLAGIFARSDYVTLHVPSNPTTKNLVNADILKNCRAGSVLLNFARPDVVSDADVMSALERGLLTQYLTDFPQPTHAAESERVYATPHLGASTAEAEENCAVMAARQLEAFLRYGTIENSVNFPAVNLEADEGFRIGISNYNVAGMLGPVLSAFADRGINVIDMINKSRDDVAYNLIDIDTPPAPDLLEEIGSINSVISIRTFQKSPDDESGL